MHIDIFDENKNENWPDSMSWFGVRWHWKWRSGVGRLIQKCKYFTSFGFRGIARFAEFSVSRAAQFFSQRYRLITTMPFVLFSQFNLSLIYSIFKTHFSFMKFRNSFQHFSMRSKKVWLGSECNCEWYCRVKSRLNSDFMRHEPKSPILVTNHWIFHCSLQFSLHGYFEYF